jgi:uncharacterized protein (DUF58 family)
MGSMFKRLRLEKEVWLRFLAALLGLALAFAAAIFSTAARQAGQVWATAILASLALLMAGAVGLIAVPYLLRRIALQRLREAMDYEMTREGVVYLAIVLVIGIAALNTGNNLLFIVLSAMLAAVLVSGLTSAWMLRGLSVEAGLPQHIFAGQKVQGRLSLRNRRRLVPAFSVTIVPPRARNVRRFRWEPRVFAIPRNRPPSKQWLRLPDAALRLHQESNVPPAIFSEREYFPFLSAAASTPRVVELLFPRRGRYRQDEFGISTRFPFSFLVKTRRVILPKRESARNPQKGSGSDDREIVVYPPVEPTDTFFEVLPLITGEFEMFVRGRGHDLYCIRDYVGGDSARHVDWKATARSQALKVREFTREDERRLRIVFDNPGAGEVAEDAYERTVSLAASLAWHFAGEHAELTFAAPGFPGSSDVYDFLRYLALVQPGTGLASGRSSFLDTLTLSDSYNIIFTSRPRGSIPTGLWTSAYMLFFSEIR